MKRRLRLEDLQMILKAPGSPGWVLDFLLPKDPGRSCSFPGLRLRFLLGRALPEWNSLYSLGVLGKDPLGTKDHQKHQNKSIEDLPGGVDIAGGAGDEAERLGNSHQDRRPHNRSPEIRLSSQNDHDDDENRYLNRKGKRAYKGYVMGHKATRNCRQTAGQSKHQHFREGDSYQARGLHSRLPGWPSALFQRVNG